MSAVPKDVRTMLPSQLQVVPCRSSHGGCRRGSVPADAEQDNGKQKIMKAFILDRYKKKGALRFGDMPEPQLRDGDVLVEIHAAGLNQLNSEIQGR